MKISKSLLSAITAGVLMSTTISCDKTEILEGEIQHLETCSEDCTSTHKANQETIHHGLDCPACGMG